ncbi:hypothetical protein Tcan_00112 [Toxocara canis]|uniref:Uncharacterized protein n=1 Tax=Toxocara canis TaxID=6265 RepID=A0A0B2VYQ0_TOXCA|nr:hypothetical protein Tcan_00112 [Toxocara canis]
MLMVVSRCSWSSLYACPRRSMTWLSLNAYSHRSMLVVFAQWLRSSPDCDLRLMRRTFISIVSTAVINYPQTALVYSTVILLGCASKQFVWFNRIFVNRKAHHSIYACCKLLMIVTVQDDFCLRKRSMK